MAPAMLSLLRRRRACRLVRGTISVAVAATFAACAPTWPPCVSLTWNSRSANRKARIARGSARNSVCPRRRESPVIQGANDLRRNVAYLPRPAETRSAPSARRRTPPPSAARHTRRRCRGSAGCRERNRFVVSHRRHDSAVALRFHIDQTIDDGGRLRSAIDVVANKQIRTPTAGRRRAFRNAARGRAACPNSRECRRRRR